MDWKLWVTGLRPKTLPASVAPVFVGAASAWHALQQSTICPDIYPVPQACITATQRYQAAQERFSTVLIACALLALFLQVAVNFANDYSDGIRGTDAARHVEESYSDKPQRLVASGVKPSLVLTAAAISAISACVFGMIAVLISGQYLLIPIGVLCVLAGWFYTGGKHPYGYSGFGELLVFLCFGGVATLGTQYALAARIDSLGILGAVCTGLLSCVMLMVNNLRDLSQDEAVAKRTLAVRLGRNRATVALYVAVLIPAAVMVCAIFLSVSSDLERLWPLSLSATLALGSMWSVVSTVHNQQFKSALSRSGTALLLYAVTHIVAVVLVA
ncbi:1,4-dihydroxy-2-naphthoate octaprenyltransferase [Bifidobacterium sp.]|jgi:1,4-dihydroxy-2-naphthoate octaprenyltransferase|uniref:1,4-dihydroxy-2-naphthoate octaprenyltransferase n=1 Tax=Bifidobacterium sp. TaxID=41200 RepID=UPI0025BC0660|nr:1,4-dihydroxy-2-naphthoate octaprenyltransferase [Bifidobacterium sp.]MCI1635356.1 1,4-dihydroxy-2-naphthoate octaprenyltransferase [Bifidobacterium sp.]